MLKHDLILPKFSLAWMGNLSALKMCLPDRHTSQPLLGQTEPPKDFAVNITHSMVYWIDWICKYPLTSMHFSLFEEFVSEKNEDLDEDLDEDLVVAFQRLDGQRLFHVFHLKGTCIGPLGKTWDRGGEGLGLELAKAVSRFSRFSRSEPSKVPTPPC